ncbi:hypothetical protein LX32DRAFT_676048 [Colletotrichum zoysiae]|uniref:Uncharacterized protein n=1 Tax=Colletotrichum zoysiae TaxID=1216348 RepID=A0AAD9LW38_9PEZI|nr:hypothetical protein LX32DRAFT_676048 [Colletotrichum zoysiae]
MPGADNPPWAMYDSFCKQSRNPIASAEELTAPRPVNPSTEIKERRGLLDLDSTPTPRASALAVIEHRLTSVSVDSLVPTALVTPQGLVFPINDNFRSHPNKSHAFPPCFDSRHRCHYSLPIPVVSLLASRCNHTSTTTTFGHQPPSQTGLRVIQS